MTTHYPHFVVGRNTTIGGLRRGAHFVNLRGMAQSEPEYREIGERLAAIRKSQSDLSQKGWAEKHGFNQTQYNTWEKGTRRIPVDEAEKLCSLYGLTLDFVYLGRRDGLADRIRNVL